MSQTVLGRVEIDPRPFLPLAKLWPGAEVNKQDNEEVDIDSDYLEIRLEANRSGELDIKGIEVAEGYDLTPLEVFNTLLPELTRAARSGGYKSVTIHKFEAPELIDAAKKAGFVERQYDFELQLRA